MPTLEEINLLGYKQQKLYGRWYPSVDSEQSPVLILLHGLWTDSREFGDFPFLLSAHYNVSVLTFDFSGHGRSEGEKLLLSQGIQLADAGAAVDYAQLHTKKGVLVLGHSFGAHTALLLQHRQECVIGSILVAPQIRSGDSLGLISKSLFKLIGMFYVLLPFFPSVYLNNYASYRELYMSAAAVLYATKIGFISEKKNLKVSGYACSVDNSRYVASSVKPLLIVGCEHDLQIPETRVKALAGFAEGNNAEYYLLANAGHSPFIETSCNLLLNKISGFCHEVIKKD